MGYWSTVIMAIAFETQEKRDIFLTEAFLATDSKQPFGLDLTTSPTEIRFGPVMTKWNPEVDFSGETGFFSGHDEYDTALVALYRYAEEAQEGVETSAGGTTPSWGETSGAWIRDGEEDTDVASGAYAEGWDLVYYRTVFGFGDEEAIAPQ